MDHIAHIRNSDGARQSVSEHCRSVAERSRAYGEMAGLGKLCELQGLLHDIGKLTEDFDQYITGRSKYMRGDIDHAFGGAKYLGELPDLYEKKEFSETANLIMRTVISHHGLHDWINDEGMDYCRKRIEKTERYEEICRNAEEFISPEEVLELLKQASAEYLAVSKKLSQLAKRNSKENQKTAYAFYLGMLERFAESVLVDADRTDTADFMSAGETETRYDVRTVWGDMDRKMEQKIAGFRGKTDDISKKRMDISDRCKAFADHSVGVCRLIVPTGGGKTLSALRFAISYCREYDMQKIIYIAPFMSILEQNSDEIRSVSGDNVFLEHHSDMLANIDYENELSMYELHSEKWDSPLIATTMVQFLNTLFSGKMACVRRMHRLCKSVVIIDEIQSLPLKCINMFNLAMNFLTNICGCTVVLCSATQPPLDDLQFPLLIDEKSSMTGDFSMDFEMFRRTELISRLTPYGYSYEDAAEFCKEKTREHGNLLLIVNTKSAAAELYRILRDNDENVLTVHLSTNLCAQHRRERLDEIRRALNENKPIVCVTTQLIEAGVDISFRCVVRSLAGLDNAAQAAGRCNRHGEAGCICPIYLIRLRDENLGSLTDIKDSQRITDRMIHYDNDSDMLSPKKLEEYFSERYSCDPEKLSYLYAAEKTTLLSLLSLNKDRYNMMQSRSHSPYTVQAFKTAGSAFQVIDSNTADIIVPYNEDAESLIRMLDEENDPKSWTDMIRKAQKYSVSVYQATGRKLAENHAVRLLKSGVLALDKEFYDSDLGVITENAVRDVLIF